MLNLILKDSQKHTPERYITIGVFLFSCKRLSRRNVLMGGVISKIVVAFEGPPSQYQLILCSGLQLAPGAPDGRFQCCLWTPSHIRMFFFLIFAVLCTSSVAAPAMVPNSYSVAVGGGSGTSFSTEGMGRITAIRVWEIPNAYITGIQLRYEYIWSARVGRVYHKAHELILFDNEVIVQVSGKFHPSNYIYQVIFVTSRGRSLVVGQPQQRSFNMYANHVDAELRLLSGRYNGNGITSLAAHWGAVYMNQGNSSSTE
ncbi:zymogen granule membrane protein 16-like isoform X4 [Acanthopagrus latus]|uniref:zymogen granule membrane protein 16-like isoform X4 n=1 Tax=Acanthopagrus latus TaxID=8177 RepID=UPI00187C151B|nr:zymogen granule membrane protein 16-like isoform X4 [Acanthopagrus latus]